jgi:hypothetical protein
MSKLVKSAQFCDQRGL